MKIALCSSFVPFIHGGARNIVDWLAVKLKEAGHQAEIVYLPEVDSKNSLFQQMMAYRWVNLEAADRIICFRPQAHLIPHPHKILWFIHHIRVFYDLWDSEYCAMPHDPEHEGFRRALHKLDTNAFKEAKKIFTNSQVVSHRLKNYNQIDSEVLYPPVLNASHFHCTDFNDEVVYICRLEHHKRQHLLVEAMAYTKTPVRLKICGRSSNQHYPAQLLKRITELHLQSRVTIENRWISEDEKIKLLSHCLAAAYLPLDEDSYGYPSLEASHAKKPVLTTTDSGGVLELIHDKINGYVTEPSPQALADAMDQLYHKREETKKMGQAACDKISELKISWEHTLDKLLT